MVAVLPDETSPGAALASSCRVIFSSVAGLIGGSNGVAILEGTGVM